MVYKTNESIIMIQAEATSPNRTNVVFWSHDRGTAKLRMKLVRKNGIPQSLPEGTTVPIRLMLKSATAEGGYGKHDYLATIEDRVNGIVSIVLEDNILGYVGIVEGSVYIDFPNDRSLDTAGRFTFDIKRSPIDDSTPELEDYYFNGFSQTIDKIEKILADGKQEIEQKITESETQIDGKLKETSNKITKANQDVATINTNIDKANDRIDQTNQQISDLGKLKKMYSNSIDFGNYDYSGNPNLMNNLSFSDFAIQAGGGTISDGGKFLKINKTSGSNLFVMAGYKNSAYYLTPVLPNTTYTITYVLRKSSNFVPQSGKRIILRYRLNQNDVTNNLGELMLDSTNVTDEFTTYTKTFTTGTLVNPNSYYFQVLVEEGLSGEIELSYEIKLERGSTAT
ncbi:TPA: BppU family phage baseplate upper protein, partial [Enterococcus faecium]